jgi:hypothetical protein
VLGIFIPIVPNKCPPSTASVVLLYVSCNLLLRRIYHLWAMAPCYFRAVSIFFMFLQICIMLVVFFGKPISPKCFEELSCSIFFTNQYECQLFFSPPSGIWGYLWG